MSSAADRASQAAKLQAEFENFASRSPEMEAVLVLEGGRPEVPIFRAMVDYSGLYGGEIAIDQSTGQFGFNERNHEVRTKQQQELSRELVVMSERAGALVYQRPGCDSDNDLRRWLKFVLILYPSLRDSRKLVDGMTLITISEYAQFCVRVLAHVKSIYEHAALKEMASGTEAAMLPAVENGEASGIAVAYPTGNSIRRDGANWIIKFGGESGSFPVKDFASLEIVAKLLARPHEALPMEEFTLARPVTSLSKPDRLADQEKLADLKRRYEESQYGRENETAAEERERRDETAKLAAELRGLTGPAGRRRNLGRTPEDRAWETMTKGLRCLWPRLREHGMPALAEHFAQSITVEKPHITYLMPSAMLPWDTSV